VPEIPAHQGQHGPLSQKKKSAWRAEMKFFLVKAENVRPNGKIGTIGKIGTMSNFSCM
jgi:hypothetical protein